MYNPFPIKTNLNNTTTTLDDKLVMQNSTTASYSSNSLFYDASNNFRISPSSNGYVIDSSNNLTLGQNSATIIDGVSITANQPFTIGWNITTDTHMLGASITSSDIVYPPTPVLDQLFTITIPLSTGKYLFNLSVLVTIDMQHATLIESYVKDSITNAIYNGSISVYHPTNGSVQLSLPVTTIATSSAGAIAVFRLLGNAQPVTYSGLTMSFTALRVN